MLQQSQCLDMEQDIEAADVVLVHSTALYVVPAVCRTNLVVSWTKIMAQSFQRLNKMQAGLHSLSRALASRNGLALDISLSYVCR